MDILERAIAAVSPGWGLSRMNARARIDLARSYEGASKGKRLDGWHAPGGGANSSVEHSAAILRDRARQLVRDNTWAKRAVNAIANNTVGHGIIPLVEGKAKSAPAGQQFQEWWKEWANSTVCDADGRHDLAGLQRLYIRTIAESGDCLVRARIRPVTDGFPIPLQIQLLEPDHLDDRPLQSAGGGKFVGGIHFDKIGRRSGYQLFRDHPGDTTSLSMDSSFVPARFMSHGYLQERPGQVRGVTWLAAAIVRLYDLGGYEDAELMRQKLAACFAAFVTNPMGEIKKGKGAAPFDLLEPGSITLLPPGADVKFGSPPQMDGYGAFVAQQLRAIAASMGLTYEMLAQDYSKTNFSSGRMGHLEAQRTIGVWQKDQVVNHFCAPVLNWAVAAASLVGRQSKAVPVLWVPPRREMIDPTKEVPALVLAIQAGLITWQTAVQSMGYDPTAQLESIEEIQNEMKAKGVDLVTAPGGAMKVKDSKSKKRALRQLKEMAEADEPNMATELLLSSS